MAHCHCSVSLRAIPGTFRSFSFSSIDLNPRARLTRTLEHVVQLAYLNRALRLVGPTLVCPLAFCFYNTCSILSGLIYYDQWDELSNLKICLVTLGIAILLGGVWIVSIKSGTDEESSEKSKRAGTLGKGEEEDEQAGPLLDRQERYFDEPESELERTSEDEAEEVEGVAEDDEPREPLTPSYHIADFS